MIHQIIDYTDGSLGSKAADTDWLSADFRSAKLVNGVRPGGTMMRIFVTLDTARSIKIVDDQGVVLGVLENRILSADQGYVFDFPLSAARTYNLQNVSGAATVASLLMWEIEAEEA